MAYTLTNSAGKSIAVIQDGSVDKTSTSLTLPGRNYAGYGQALNEDLIYLLENFAGISAPNKPIAGQLWYDTTNKKIKIYNGTAFKSLSNLEYSSTTPTNQVSGDLWINTNTNQLYFFDGIKYNLIGPLETGQKVNQVVPSIVYDKVGNVQNIITIIINGITAFIFSTTEFQLDGTKTPITGFADGSTIYKGINLPSQSVYPNIQFAGVAQTAASLLVNGTQIPASQIVLNSGSQQNITSSLKVNVSPTSNTQAGIFVGTAGDLYLSASSGVGTISNVNGNSLVFAVKPTSQNSSSAVLQVNDTAILPAVGDVYNIGSSTVRLNSIYANNFFAIDDPNLTSGNGFFQGKLVGTTVSASQGFSGDLTGNVINALAGGNAKAVDVSNAVTVFTGTLRGAHIGNVSGNLVSGTTSQVVVDTTGVVASFTGIFNGTATNASGLLVSSTSYPALVGGSGVLPNSYNNTAAVRDSNGNLYANSFKGIADTAVQVIDATSGTGRSASSGSWTNTGLVVSDPNTLVIRDASGSINVGLIRGVSWNSQAVGNAIPSITNTYSGSGYPGGPVVGTLVQREATTGDIYVSTVHATAVNTSGGDLAEWYHTNDNLDQGTVVTLGGDSEVTTATDPLTAFGVVSTSPGVLINDGDTTSFNAVPVAMIGRVGVKVKGPLRKGERIMLSDEPGVATKWDGKNVLAILGRATCDNLDEGIKVTECSVLVR